MGTVPITANPNSPPSTSSDTDHPNPEELPPDQSTQAENFGINNLLTEGTFYGDKGETGDNTSVLVEQTTRTDEDPRTVILGRRRGKPQTRNVNGPTASKELEHIAKTTQAEPGSHTEHNPVPSPPQESTTRPSYNQARLAIRGGERQNSKTHHRVDAAPHVLSQGHVKRGQLHRMSGETLRATWHPRWGKESRKSRR